MSGMIRDNVKVSVIIPTFNRCKYLQIAIDSVLAQSYTNYELIVVDDGSTDETEKVIKEKYKERLIYVWQKNQGEAKARNVGISLSSGKYIAFLDSDDKWHADKLNSQVDYIEKRRKRDNNIALVFSSVWLIDGADELITNRISGRKTNIEKLHLEDYLCHPQIFAPSSNCLFYAEFLREVGGFNEKIQFGEDLELLIRLREKFSFIYFDKPLTYYRVHNVNQQSFPNHNLIERKLSDSLLLVDLFPRRKLTDTQIIKAKAYYYERAAYWYFTYHDWENGLKYLIQAGNLNQECIINKEKAIRTIAFLGYESAKFNAGRIVPDLLNYFENYYYPNLNNYWPNDLLLDSEVRRKIIATFCHILVCDENLIKTRKENIQLCKKAFSYIRYLRSITIWRIFLNNLLSPSHK